MIYGNKGMAGTEKRQSTNRAVRKQSPSSSSRNIHNVSLSSAGTKAPHPSGRWNDDVDPLDLNKLKLGLCCPLPQFYAEFSAQAPS